MRWPGLSCVCLVDEEGAIYVAATKPTLFAETSALAKAKQKWLKSVNLANIEICSFLWADG